MKKIICLIITVSIFSCASHKKVNKLASHLKCDKEIYFTFDESNKDVVIEKRGWHLGNSKVPDFENSFARSLRKLSTNSNLNLNFNKTYKKQIDSDNKVNVKIDSIIWNFGFSSAIMETFINYELPEKSIRVIGKNKIYLQGTKKGNLYKSLKHGNYLFLNKFCRE